MAVEVIMPKVDMDMASGKVVTWHVAVGERVEKGAPLFDIETDKAAMEVEAPASGILQRAVAEGTDVPIGQPVAWLYAEGEAVRDDAGPATTGRPPAEGDSAVPDAGVLVAATGAPAGSVAVQHAPSATAAPAAWSPASSVHPLPGPVGPADDATAKVRATPMARSLAREAGIALDGVPGTGHRGRIQGDDVRAVVEARTVAAPAPAGFAHELGPLAVTRSRGGSGMPVVLIHGFASDALSWAPLEAQMKGAAFIRIELPCHGKSPKRRLAGFAALVSEVRRAFDGLDAGRVHLVGHSLGGAVALALADTRAAAVAGLTMIAPAGLGPEVNGAALDGIARATRAESLAPWLRALVGDEALITDAYARLAMTARADPALRAAQQAMAEAMFPDGVQAFDVRAALDRLEVPGRIVWGKADRIIPWRHALRAPGRVALHLFEGVGHMPQLEAAAEVAAILRSSP